jgi:hypothetical protein
MAKLQVPSNAETIRREGRRWPLLLLLIIVSLIVATGVALGGRWVYREYVEDGPKQAAPAETQATEQSQTEQQNGGDESQQQQGGTETGPLPDTGG